MSLMGAVRNLLGIKGADGTTIASPDNPVPTQLSGSTIEIGGVMFGLSGGDTIRGPAASRPTAADAHAALAYAFYYAVDTGAASATDGTSWEPVG